MLLPLLSVAKLKASMGREVLKSPVPFMTGGPSTLIVWCAGSK